MKLTFTQAKRKYELLDSAYNNLNTHISLRKAKIEALEAKKNSLTIQQDDLIHVLNTNLDELFTAIQMQQNIKFDIRLFPDIADDFKQFWNSALDNSSLLVSDLAKYNQLNINQRINQLDVSKHPRNILIVEKLRIKNSKLMLLIFNLCKLIKQNAANKQKNKEKTSEKENEDLDLNQPKNKHLKDELLNHYHEVNNLITANSLVTPHIILNQALQREIIEIDLDRSNTESKIESEKLQTAIAEINLEIENNRLLAAEAELKMAAIVEGINKLEVLNTALEMNHKIYKKIFHEMYADLTKEMLQEAVRNKRTADSFERLKKDEKIKKALTYRAHLQAIRRCHEYMPAQINVEYRNDKPNSKQDPVAVKQQIPILLNVLANQIKRPIALEISQLPEYSIFKDIFPRTAPTP